MFKIQGTDQKEYGPVTAEVMRQWIAERRVDGRTQVQADGTTVWKPLSEFPEFASALTAARPLPAGVPPVPASSGPVKTSGMAVASLVLGTLGCLGITGLLGLVFGAISLAQIRKSQGRLRGTGLAIAGLCVSGFMLLTVPIAAGLLLPAFAKAKGRAQSIHCVSNLKQLALACRMYAADNKDTIPGAGSWCDDLQAYVADPRVFRCKAASTGQRGTYAINARIAGRKEDDVNPSTVLLFEIQGGWNMSGGPEMVIPASRHRSIVNVAFADGSVSQMQVNRLPTLRWDP